MKYNFVRLRCGLKDHHTKLGSFVNEAEKDELAVDSVRRAGLNLRGEGEHEFVEVHKIKCPSLLKGKPYLEMYY